MIDLKEIKNKILKKENFYFLLIISAIFFLDRYSKIIVMKDFSEKSAYINNFLNFDLVWNTGIGFGLLNWDNSIFYNMTSAVIGLIILIFITSVSISYFNYKKNLNEKTYIEFIDNIYFQKTLSYLFENLDPKYKKIKHIVKSGETFDKILESYSIEKSEIIKIKNSLKKKININKLNTRQIIQFSLDKTNNKIDEFTYQVSNTQKIYLKRNIEEDIFKKEIILIKLNKKIVYKENLIDQSLYRSATEIKIPPNTIIEFAGVYGFQVDFQRDIRRNDKFQIMSDTF